MKGINLANTELTRITSAVKPDRETFDSSERDRFLAHKSKSRVSCWENTLEAERRRETEAIQERKEEDEARRRKMDIEEANIQLEARRAAISRANSILAIDNERMKTFQTAMMLADVLSERDNQIRIKEQLNKLEKIRDLKYNELMKHNCEMMKRREAFDTKTQADKRKLIADAQKEQLTKKEELKALDRENKQLEGDMIRRLNEEYLEEEIQRKRHDRDIALGAQRETLRAQEYLKEIKNREIQRISTEDASIQEYAIKKEEILDKRRERSEFLLREKQRARNKLIEIQAEKLAELKDNEDQRVQQQCLDSEIEQSRVLAERAIRMETWKREIEESRRFEVERRSKERERKKEEETRAAEFSRAISYKLQQDELEDQSQRREASRRLANDLLVQMELKRQKKFDHVRADFKTSERAQRATQSDILEFQEFAEVAIKEYAENGKNVVPLIQALKDFHKKREQV